MDHQSWPPVIPIVAPPTGLQWMLRGSCTVVLGLMFVGRFTRGPEDPDGGRDLRGMVLLLCMLPSALLALLSTAILVLGWVSRFWTLRPVTRWVLGVLLFCAWFTHGLS